jgi:hypothetical protein
MPTPFTHLAYAHRLLNDVTFSTHTPRLKSQVSAFLLGSIVADARTDSPKGRAATHFYHYTEAMSDHPWRIMLKENPVLAHPNEEAWRMFVAGYVFHLGMDEYWSVEMLEPHFANGAWGKDRYNRFYVLHLLLISMDERDYKTLPQSDIEALCAVSPENWLPFMPDKIILDWGDFIAQQISTTSETLQIFGGRIRRDPQELRATLDSAEEMQRLLYQPLSPEFLTDFEEKMYAFAKEQLRIYLSEL